MKIVLEKGQGLFFTSDTHYNHGNICRATTNWVGADNLTRDYKSLNHMNDTLVNRINEMVGENDILVHLDTFTFHLTFVLTRDEQWMLEWTETTCIQFLLRKSVTL